MVFHFDYSSDSLDKRSKVFGRLSLITFVLLLIVIGANAQDSSNTSDTTVGWYDRSIEISETLYDLHTIDRENAIAIGQNGIVVFTNNNGTTWSSIDTGVTSDLYSIDSVGNVTIVAGIGGTLLLNTTSGWLDISPTTIDFYAINIALVNETHTIAFAGGENGELWKTVDAGTSWIQISTNSNEQINDISFLNETHGLVVGENGLLLGTLDGQNFAPRDLAVDVETQDLNAVEFYSAIRAFIVGDEGTFLRSDISDTPFTGFSWQEWDTSTTQNLYDLDAVSSNKIYITGANSTVLLTKDGGNTFNPQKSSVLEKDLHAIEMADGFFGFIAGSDGTTLFTDREGIAEDELPTVRDFNDFSVYWEESFPLIIQGFFNMLRIIFLSMIFGFILGMSLAVGKTVEFKLVNIISIIYTDFFRNTPLLVQFFVIHFGFPELGIDLTFGGVFENRAFASSLIALSLNSGAYQSEIIRSGIQAIPTGQMEAGRSVGLTYGQTMRYVILPQAIRVVIPPLGNEFVNLTLNSSLASVTGYFELTRAGRLIIAITFLNFQTWLIIALFYFIITYTLTNILRYTEKKTRIPGLGLGRN